MHEVIWYGDCGLIYISKLGQIVIFAAFLD